MSDYEFLPDEEALPIVLNSMSANKTTASMVRLALSLGAVIAGGAAISLFESRTQKEEPEIATPYPPNARVRKTISNRFLWRDVDFWFPNDESLKAYLATIATDPNIQHKPSFGGHALDVLTTDGGPQLQVITFRTGNPTEIISQFDFVNCAVAFDGKGFWYHKDVPALAKAKKLSMLNDNSAWFLSRVHKYLKKGYYTIDDLIRDRLYRELTDIADKGLELASSFKPELDKPLKEFDKTYHPTYKAICKAESLLMRFVMLRGRSTGSLFDSEQDKSITGKLEKISDFRESMGATRKRIFNLPYGYTASSSDTKDSDVDSLLGLI